VEATKRFARGPVAGFVGGLCLLAPGAGAALVGVWRLVSGFGAVEGSAVAPGDKAKVLAAAISGAMDLIAVGIGVGIVGLVLAGVSVYLLFGRRSEEASPS